MMNFLVKRLIFFDIENHLPDDVARMIAAKVCPDSILKEEIMLLKTWAGQSYMHNKMYKEAKAKEAIEGVSPGIFRRII